MSVSSITQKHQNHMEYSISFVSSLLSEETVQEPQPDNANGTYDILYDLWCVHKSDGSQDVRDEIHAILDESDSADHHEWLRSCLEPIYRHISDLDSEPEPKWLIQDLIAENSFTMLFGESGAGKSFVVLDMAMKIAQEHPVLYGASEEPYQYKDRSQAWAKYYDTKRGDLYILESGYTVNLNGDMTSFIDGMRPLKPKLIIFDTLATSMIGDENSTRDMGFVMQNCKRIIHELGTAVLLVHHTTKNGNGYRGSSVIKAAIDMQIEVTKSDDMITLKCAKSRNTAPLKDKRLRLNPIKLDNRLTSLVVDAYKTITADKTPTQDQALSENESVIIKYLFSSDRFDKGARSKEFRLATKLKGGTFDRTRKRLSERGFIKKGDGKTDPWILTSEGKQLAIKLGFKPKPPATKRRRKKVSR